MSIEIMDVLEHFVTHEFVTLVDLVMWVSRAIGIYLSIRGLVAWYIVYRSKSSTMTLSGLYGTPPSLQQIFSLAIASSMFWNLGSGIMLFGQLLYGPVNIDVSNPFNAVMFDSITQQAANLVNADIAGSREATLNGTIMFRFALSIFSLFGLYSYFQGVSAIAKLGEPNSQTQISMGGIFFRCLFGAGLILIDNAYSLIDTTITQTSARS